MLIVTALPGCVLWPEVLLYPFSVTSFLGLFRTAVVFLSAKGLMNAASSVLFCQENLSVVFPAYDFTLTPCSLSLLSELTGCTLGVAGVVDGVRVLLTIVSRVEEKMKILSNMPSLTVWSWHLV